MAAAGGWGNKYHNWALKFCREALLQHGAVDMGLPLDAEAPIAIPMVEHPHAGDQIRGAEYVLMYDGPRLQWSWVDLISSLVDDDISELLSSPDFAPADPLGAPSERKRVAARAAARG